MILTPLPKQNTSYSNTIHTVTPGFAITSATVSAGALPTGLSLSFTAFVIQITGTPTVLGSSSFTISYTESVGGFPINYSQNYTTQVILAPIQSPNPIAWSNLGAFTGQPANISMNSNRIRLLANGVIDSSQVKLSSCYNKPTPGSVSRSIFGFQTFTVPPYQALVVKVAGAGGGGGYGEETQLQNGVCVSIDGTATGSNGGNSSSLGLVSYGGTGGGAGTGYAQSGGNNQNGLLGGGSPGGAGIAGPGCASNPAQSGGFGGYSDALKLIASNTLEYGDNFLMTVGPGGAGGKTAGRGTDGYVTVTWA